MKARLAVSSVIALAIGCRMSAGILDVGTDQAKGPAGASDAAGIQPRDAYVDAELDAETVEASVDATAPPDADEGDSDTSGDCDADTPPVGTYAGPYVSEVVPDLRGTITMTLTMTGESVYGTFNSNWTTPGLYIDGAPLAGDIHCATGEIDLAGTASAGQTYVLVMTYSALSRSLLGTYSWREGDSALGDSGTFTLTWSPPDAGDD
jgi:hypothetical protein